MDLSFTLRFRPPNPPLSRRKLESPIIHPLKGFLPTFHRPDINPNAKPFPMSSRTHQSTVVTAKLNKPIDGVSEELNLIASQNLDHAPARRRVRSAFAQVQQELDHPLFKMTPPGKTYEWYERNSRGSEIFCKRWIPEPGVRMKGAVFFSHGYGDTCTFFFEGIANRIVASGYGVYALDHPGFGLSEGLHGYIPSFDELADNVIEQYTKIKGRPELRGLPCFLLGQSMGGAVALKVHLKEPRAWDGIILVAPIYAKSKALATERSSSTLLQRPEEKKNVADYNVICYNDQMRLKTAVELLNATKDIEKQVEKVSSPLLILHGAADKVTDPLVSQFLYQKASSKDKTLKLYEGAYHSILEGEPDTNIFAVFDDIIAWLDSRCSAK
ncbi:caffeoylshikimate esterase [Populus alba x Populus x berolinensis]|nr:caffeoylshikimate esterase [Populus alba x Populus x berolinensis]